MATTITQDQITAKANELARKYGYSSVQDLQNAYRSAIGSGSDVAQAEAVTDAASFLGDLTLFCLYQNIDTGYKLHGYDWVNRIDTKRIEVGNEEQWVHPLVTGAGEYSTLPFIPDKTYDPQVVTSSIKFYNPDLTLTQYAYKFRKILTLIEEKYTPFFISGRLSEFLMTVVEQMNKSYDLFKISKVQQLIGDLLAPQTDLNKPALVQKHVAGTATDFLSCFTDDIYPMITEMSLLSKKYNLGTFKNAPITGTSASDLLMFVNQSVYTRLTGGKLANVFNNVLITPSKFIPVENIYPMGDLVKYTDNDTAVDVADDVPIIPENTILIIDKSAIKLREFIKRHEQQLYTHNLAVNVTKHEWAVYGVLPWKQGFIYTNNALMKTPPATTPAK